jgi:RNA polymerase sigma-70 factor (ECF subfamily)
MAEEASFSDLINRVRSGDEHAAAELVRRYEPAIRRVVRFRLAPSLRRFCDSVDICQAVLGKFFVYAANGELELETPEHLMNLLAAMARNEVLKEARKQRAARRDHRRDTGGAVEEREVAAAGETPSQEVAARELLHEVRRRLTGEERRLAELRSAGHDWAAVAAEVGGSPEALRKQLTRAVARAMRQLGLDEDGAEG